MINSGDIKENAYGKSRRTPNLGFAQLLVIKISCFILRFARRYVTASSVCGETLIVSCIVDPELEASINEKPYHFCRFD
jgi:hypothetical protein